MHFHLPKPLHGWREFVGEVGIIVVGVLIALGAEQLVETQHWQKRVAEAREDLHTELAGDLFNALERMRFEGCVGRRLDRLSEMIDHPPSRPWKLLPGGRGLVPIRVWSSSGWDSAIAAGAVSHMSREERSQYASLYSLIRGLHAMVLDEFAVTTEVKMLERGGPLSEASQDRLRADVARLEGYNHILVIGSAQLAKSIEDMGIRLDPISRKELEAETCPMPGATKVDPGKG